MEKENLWDVTFVFPLRTDSVERIMNLTTVLDYLSTHINSHYIVLEAGKVPGGTNLKQRPDTLYLYCRDMHDVFHHTRYRNGMIRLASTPIVAVWDTDVVVSIPQIMEAVGKIRRNEAVMSYPYNGRFLNVNPTASQHFRTTIDMKELIEASSLFPTMYGFHSVGGAFIVNREIYMKAGMENENIRGWGPEDPERLKRMTILRLPVHRVAGDLFHLWHPRGSNSGFTSEERNIQSKKEFLEICSSGHEELWEKIRTWPWITERHSPDISVIIPAWNVARYLCQSIESVLSQTSVTTEIIIIDDGSADATGKIADLYAHCEKNIQVIHQSNHGLASARNRGLKAATGKYILFLDGDDWLCHEALYRLYATAEIHQAEIVMGNVIFYYSEQQQTTHYHRFPLKNAHQPIPGEEAFALLMNHQSFPPMVPNYLYRTSWLKDSGIHFENVIHEDELWTPQIITKSSRFVISDVDTYHYRQRSGSLSHTRNNRKKFNDLLHIIRKLRQNPMLRHSDETIRLQWYLKILELYTAAFRQLNELNREDIEPTGHEFYRTYFEIKNIGPHFREACKPYLIKASEHLKNFMQQGQDRKTKQKNTPISCPTDQKTNNILKQIFSFCSCQYDKLATILLFPDTRKVDFMIIGTQKGGTTSLHEYLNQHPDCIGSKNKETGYFLFPEIHLQGKDWYKKQWIQKGRFLPGHLLFESSTWYSYWPDVPRRLAEYAPGLKFIFLVRNPIDRAYSQYNMLTQWDRKKILYEYHLMKEEAKSYLFAERLQNPSRYPFSYWAELEMTRYVNGIISTDDFIPDFLHRGIYCQQLERYYHYFPARNILVVDSNELKNNKIATLHQIEDFLNIKHINWNSIDLNDRHILEYKSSFPEGIREKLRNFYHPFNQRLFDMIGREYDWK